MHGDESILAEPSDRVVTSSISIVDHNETLHGAITLEHAFVTPVSSQSITLHITEIQSSTGGAFNSITCAAQACTATQVPNSDKAGTGMITGKTTATVIVNCVAGYSGSGTATCGTNGQVEVIHQ